MSRCAFDVLPLATGIKDTIFTYLYAYRKDEALNVFLNISDNMRSYAVSRERHQVMLQLHMLPKYPGVVDRWVATQYNNDWVAAYHDIKYKGWWEYEEISIYPNDEPSMDPRTYDVTDIELLARMNAPAELRTHVTYLLENHYEYDVICRKCVYILKELMKYGLSLVQIQPLIDIVLLNDWDEDDSIMWQLDDIAFTAEVYAYIISSREWSIEHVNWLNQFCRWHVTSRRIFCATSTTTLS